ncbi:uncharacterized protein LOC132201588 [Neocloeon triangulifer]|uniref:uncharacterized protein LOC132201588 n=1 Tax=Neocloeon triangulifer TaxID=2078957 RepID=UPI00286ED051|nr:uncharacterized protein LOC132201588 [Neocloeon triangulifer]
MHDDYNETAGPNFDLADLFSNFNSSDTWKVVDDFLQRIKNGKFGRHGKIATTTLPPVLDDEEDLTLCDRLFVVIDLLHVYYIPAIVVAGVLCNLLNVVVFTSTYLRRRSSSYYLAALALSDTCFLITLGLIWTGDSLGVNTFNKEGWCQGVVYLSTASSSLSVWLTVGFTVERFVAVKYPLQRPHICTVAKAKAVVLGTVFVSLVLSSYGLLTAGVVERGHGVQSCDVKPQFRDLMRVVTVIDSILTLALPSVLIGLMNMFIVRCLMKFRQQLRLDGISNEESSDQPSNSMPMMLAEVAA